MEKITISVTYNVKHWLSDYVCLTVCGRVINIKLGKEIKPILRGSKKCYFINRKFTSDLNPIKRDIKCPF
jgi:hypothetical protein